MISLRCWNPGSLPLRRVQKAFGVFSCYGTPHLHPIATHFASPRVGVFHCFEGITREKKTLRDPKLSQAREIIIKQVIVFTIVFASSPRLASPQFRFIFAYLGPPRHTLCRGVNINSLRPRPKSLRQSLRHVATLPIPET